MITVLDASAAVEVVLQRPQADEIGEIILKADWVIAPTLFIAEIGNVFWKYQKMAAYPLDACETSIEHAIGIPDDYINEIELYRESFSMGCMLNHSVYDMLYLVLARRNNAILLTLDKKLKSVAQNSGVNTN
jgi:predicted nucleic acid-binding protein